MAPKKSSLRNLSKKGISKRKAGAVKGGAMRQNPDKPGKLAANHNQVVRKLKTLPKKTVSPRKAKVVKGGGIVTRNHNQSFLFR